MSERQPLPQFWNDFHIEEYGRPGIRRSLLASHYVEFFGALQQALQQNVIDVCGQ